MELPRNETGSKAIVPRDACNCQGQVRRWNACQLMTERESRRIAW